MERELKVKNYEYEEKCNIEKDPYERERKDYELVINKTFKTTNMIQNEFLKHTGGKRLRRSERRAFHVNTTIGTKYADAFFIHRNGLRG